MSPDAPRGNETALNRAVDLIVSGIRQGRYAAGQRLIEADLIEELDVSRSSVREALRRLEAQGLVEMIPHRGARVRRLTPDDVREIYEARGAIESGAARLAAQRIDEPGKRKQLKASLKALQSAARKGDVLSYFDQNSSWHDTVFEVASNKQLITLIGMMRLQTVRLTIPHYVNDPAEMTALIKRSLAQHEHIAERILAGDAEGAADAMRAHIEETAEAVLEALDSGRPRRAMTI